MIAGYYVRSGPNEELRYSLRALATHAPGATVVIAGHAPPWVNRRAVTVLPPKAGPRGTTKADRAFGNVLALAHHIDAPWAMLNDDFHATAPIVWRQYDRGRFADVLADQVANVSATSTYTLLMRGTIEWLEGHGHPDPVCYETHLPLVVDDPPLMREALAACAAHRKDRRSRTPLMPRSVYGNMRGGPSTSISDVKPTPANADTWNPDPAIGWVSTSDRTFTRTSIGKWLRATYPHPSPYER